TVQARLGLLRFRSCMDVVFIWHPNLVFDLSRPHATAGFAVGWPAFALQSRYGYRPTQTRLRLPAGTFSERECSIIARCSGLHLRPRFAFHSARSSSSKIFCARWNAEFAAGTPQ